MSLSNYLETALLNHAFRGSAYTQPAGLYLALFTSDPGETGASGEVTGNAYARQSCAGTVSGDTFTLAAPVDFPVATPSGWGTITHAAIFDAATTGNMLAGGALSASRTINAGDIYRQSSLTITLD